MPRTEQLTGTRSVGAAAPRSEVRVLVSCSQIRLCLYSPASGKMTSAIERESGACRNDRDTDVAWRQ